MTIARNAFGILNKSKKASCFRLPATLAGDCITTRWMKENTQLSRRRRPNIQLFGQMVLIYLLFPLSLQLL